MNVTLEPYPHPVQSALIELIKKQHGEDCFERWLRDGELETPYSAYRVGYEKIDWRHREKT